MATGLTTLKILKDDKIADKVAAQGEWLKGKLADLQKRYPVIGQVRGLGLMIGLEIVKPGEAQDHMGCSRPMANCPRCCRKNASKTA